ncbi:GNAT family N-acetyltransferase [Calycomorphotria hydatis]|uniref:Amino-acid acetyltransferase n=1 Tax=Calycomorphotria hydatis TaxID=2528027 RepID=A0A517TBH0_9PLAN|nr:GNAT family N-acetyltransferase [Calycomorphotria hydatis]QDT65722.1 Amino-acid acetyltransferase [Calycomorphotria hydatis]
MSESSSGESPKIDFTVRISEEADVAAVHAFLRPFIAAGRLLERTMEELDDLVGTGFIAEQNGKIVGFAALEIYSAKLAELRSLAVIPQLRGKGVGKELVKRCVQLAKDRRILEVLAISSSEEFFLSCGFDYTLPGEKKAFFCQLPSDDSAG